MPIRFRSGPNQAVDRTPLYTATWDDTCKAHSALFKPYPGTVDKTDRLMACRALVAYLYPPIIYRRIAGKLHRLDL